MRVDPNLKYRADVIPIYAVRTLLAAHNSKIHCIGILDVATAFLQTGQFKAGTPKRYVKMKDPRTGTWMYFRQLAHIYGEVDAPKEWWKVVTDWLISIGFKKADNLSDIHLRRHYCNPFL